MQEDDAPYADGENIKIFVIFSDFLIFSLVHENSSDSPNYDTRFFSDYL